MPPLILSSVIRDDGTAVAVVSVRPGRRVQLVTTRDVLQAPDAAATLAALAELTDRKGTP